MVRWLRAIGGWRCEALSHLLPSAAVAQWVEPPAALVRQQAAEELPREQRRVLLPCQVDVERVAPHLHRHRHRHMHRLVRMPCPTAAWPEYPARAIASRSA